MRRWQAAIFLSDGLSDLAPKEMHRLEQLIDELNAAVYNPVGLNILWPRRVAFLFVSHRAWPMIPYAYSPADGN
jgi:hypothetical protein